MFADDLYQVETILVRQNAVPAIISRAAPEDWAAGAQTVSPDSLRTPTQGEVEKLTASNEYSVLLHKAWQQTLGETPVKVAVSDGKEQYGQYPIEGTLNLTLDASPMWTPISGSTSSTTTAWSPPANA